MAVAVMSIRKVRMRVSYGLVPMPMAMRGAWRHRHVVLMLVMLIMGVFMLVADHFVGMLMLMTFGQMQPYPDGHQDRRNAERHCDLVPHQHCKQSAEERGDREVSARSGSAEVAQACDE